MYKRRTKQGEGGAITQMKNTQEGINGRINRAEEQISELEDKVVEITVMEE